MHKIELNGNYRKVHFIGIGGVSMSSLAEMLHAQNGFIISGSDKKDSKITKRLMELGIKISIGHSSSNITDDMDLVVYTAAVKQDNEELIEAIAKNIKTLDRAGLLGQIMNNFGCPVSITGSHGKTTATSMISQVFVSAGSDPTISVGATLPSIGGNLRLGNSEYFIVESDEYFDSFLKFYPKIAVILNIDMDHSDYFKDYDSLWQSFKKFTKNIPDDGVLVIYSGVKNINALIEGLHCRIITYGSEDSDWSARNILLDTTGCAYFKVYYKDEYKCEVQLGVAGKHNVLNALAAFATANEAGIPIEKIATGLMDFKGAERRFQNKGKFNGVTVIDDFAHHPTEIAANLVSLKSCTNQRICVAFQPHTYSRTKYFFDDFSKSFDDADMIVITDIYAARESEDNGIHSSLLAEKIRERGKDAHYFGSLNEAEDFFVKHCHSGDMLITMGAGDIYLLGERLVNRKL